MNSVLAAIKSKTDYKSVVFDIFALAFLTFVPALSHLFSIPIYYAEPMRIMIILGVVHTSRKNSYMLALAIPVLSVLISGHPAILKSLLIFSELALNVWLFFTLGKLFRNQFAAIFSSIILSKIFYYTVKFALLNAAFMEGDLITTPLYLQLIVTCVLSVYAYFMLGKSPK